MNRTSAPGARPSPPPSVTSPEVHPDRRVTFRLVMRKADTVVVSGGFGNHPMTNDGSGLWSVTVGPLAPEIHEYGFLVDDVHLLDPANSEVKPARLPVSSILHIAGDPPLPHDFEPDVPHGVVRHHWYQSNALGRRRDLCVYTPPGYDQKTRTRYPVLYLFHGSGDNQATWTVLGRAHMIADNLIARGKAKPLIIAMPDGHAALTDGKPDREGNMAAFQRDLFEDVVPLVERSYRTENEREKRAIVGLSMGGGQSLTIGLNNLGRFAWVGGMSSAVRDPEQTVASALADAATTNRNLKLLWLECGKDDFLLEQNQHFDALLTNRGIHHVYRLTDGDHSWPVWRRYLAEFLPLLFAD